MISYLYLRKVSSLPKTRESHSSVQPDSGTIPLIRKSYFFVSHIIELILRHAAQPFANLLLRCVYRRITFGCVHDLAQHEEPRLCHLAPLEWLNYSKVSNTNKV